MKYFILGLIGIIFACVVSYGFILSIVYLTSVFFNVPLDIFKISLALWFILLGTKIFLFKGK